MKYTDIRPTQPQQPYVVQPNQVKRSRLRKGIAVAIAKDQANPKPTTDDLAIGFARYAQVQRQADRQYEKARRSAAKLAQKKIGVVQETRQDPAQLLLERPDPLHAYIAVVRVKVSGSASNLRTQVWADGILQARKLLQQQYGVNSILALVPARNWERACKVS